LKKIHVFSLRGCGFWGYNRYNSTTGEKSAAFSRELLAIGLEFLGRGDIAKIKLGIANGEGKFIAGMGIFWME